MDVVKLTELKKELEKMLEALKKEQDQASRRLIFNQFKETYFRIKKELTT